MLDTWTKTPLGLSGLLLSILKDLFTWNNTPFKYSSDQVESKLYIDLHAQWDAGNCENYPAVFVKRKNLQSNVVVIGSQHEFLIEEDGYSWSYYQPISAQYDIECVAKTYGEAEVLSTYVFELLKGFSYVILDVFHFRRFDVQGISEVQILKEEKNFRGCIVPLQIDFDYFWKNTVEKSVIKQIGIQR